MNSKIPFYQKKRFLLWAVFGWSLGVLAIFYWAHKPVPAELAIKSLVPPGDLITALLAVSLCGALGRKLVGGASLAGLERFGLQAALGSGVLGTGWLLIGLAGGYQRWTAWILLGAGLVLLRREAAGWWGELGLFKSLWAQAGRVEKLLAGACGLLLTFQLLLALAPPTHWDALAYHLELPHLYLQAGRLIFVPYNLFWGNPQLGEMLFTFAAALGQLQTAPVLSTALGAVFLAGMMGFTRRVTAEWLGWDETTATRAGWAAAAALMAGFSIRHQLSWGYVDILAAPMGLGLLVCVFEWLRQRQDSWLRWAGVFLGLAVGVKYPSALLGLAVYLVILFTHRIKGSPAKRRHLAGCFFAVAVEELDFYRQPAFPIPDSKRLGQHTARAGSQPGHGKRYSHPGQPVISFLIGFDGRRKWIVVRGGNRGGGAVDGGSGVVVVLEKG